MRVDDEVIKSILFLGTFSERTGFIPLGTAFMYRIETDGMGFGHIVTARHNIEGRGKIHMRVNKKDGGSFIIETDETKWLLHPDRKNYIDAAVLRVGDVRVHSEAPRDMEIKNFHDDCILTDEVITRLKIAAGEPVVTVGMFTSHYGEIHNTPIVRIGNIAAMRSKTDLVQTSKGYMDAYLVEVRSLGGLSGSPVLVQIAPSRLIKHEVVHSSQIGCKPFYILGVMRGHFTTREPNDFVFPRGRQDRQDDADESPDEFNAGIGVVVPFDKVLEIIHQPHLEAERKAIAAKMKRQSGDKENSAAPGHKSDDGTIGPD